MPGGLLCEGWAGCVRLSARIPINGFGRLFAVNVGIGYLGDTQMLDSIECLQLLIETENRVRSAYVLLMWVAFVYKIDLLISKFNTIMDM